MAIVTTTPEHLSKLIVSSIQVEFERLVRDKLAAVANELVQAAALEATKGVVAKVAAYQDLGSVFQKIQLSVQFNGEELKS